MRSPSTVAIRPKDARNEPAHTKRPGVFEVLLHERKLAFGVHKVSSSWTQHRINGQATLCDGCTR